MLISHYMCTAIIGFARERVNSSCSKYIFHVMDTCFFFVGTLPMYKQTYGDHPRSAGLTNRIPARETVAGVAALRWPISNMSLMEGVSGTRSLLAKVRTCKNEE